MNTNPKRAVARVYRFRQSVAVSLDDGPTVYLSAEAAEALANAVANTAADIRSTSFGRSDLNPTEVR